MTRSLLFLAVAIIGLSGCPPTLTGAPCQYDCNCPSDQTCEISSETVGAAGVCATGVNTLACGPGNLDGGAPDAGITGRVTLNGGALKPSGTKAWVLVWKGGVPSVGQAPDFVVPTDDTGGFEFSQAEPGMSYGFAGQYDLDQDRIETTSAGDKITFAATASQLGDRLLLDVQTYTCVIFASHVVSDQTPRLYEASIDLPDVTSGQELSALDGGSAFLSGTTLGTVALTYATSGVLFSSPRWAFDPTAPAPVADPTYSFRISAPFYDQVVCSVTRDPGVLPPNGVTVGTAPEGTSGNWDTTVQDVVTWTTPSSETALLPLIDLLGPGIPPRVFAVTTAMVGTTSMTFPGPTMRNATCTGQGGGVLNCICEVTLIKQTGPATSLALEGASFEMPFQVSSN